MKKQFLSILFISVVFSSLSAGNVKLLVRPSASDSILLRWAPADKDSWNLGNRYGYIVERYTILRQGRQPEYPERIRLTPNPLKPAPLDEWERYIDADRYAAIAAELIFGERIITPVLSPTAIARQFQQEQNRFSFALYAADQSLTAARLSGLHFVDRTARADEKYLYAVFIALPDTLPSDTAFAFTGLSEFQPLPPPIGLEASWGDRRVELSWNILYRSHLYNSYIIERSTDGENFTRISESAAVQASAVGVIPEFAYRTDSLPDNRTTFHYRIRGISAFGEISPPSEAVVGRGRIPLTFAPTIVNNEVINNEAVRLTWEFPEEMNEYIDGFRIFRSASPTGIKDQLYEITESSARTFTDTNPGLTNYYVLSVFDAHTEKFTSGHIYAELIDSIPPIPPINLAGMIDSIGVVTLSWSANTEEDLDGYRVYRSNHPDFEFQLISSDIVRDTTFTDFVQVRTLTRSVYYRFRAIDLRGNQSEFSEILQLTRPSVIPPVSPLIQSVSETENGIEIRWINSSSVDVTAHHIYRKMPNDSTSIRIFTFENRDESQSSHTDNTVRQGEMYIYYVVAENSGGLLSTPSSPVQQRAPGRLAEQIVLRGTSSLDGIVLTWTVQTQRQPARILIYKAENDEPLRLFGNTTESSFTDRTTAFERTFRYRIRVIYEDGSSSELSNEVSVSL